MMIVFLLYFSCNLDCKSNSLILRFPEVIFPFVTVPGDATPILSISFKLKLFSCKILFNNSSMLFTIAFSISFLSSSEKNLSTVAFNSTPSINPKPI